MDLIKGIQGISFIFLPLQAVAKHQQRRVVYASPLLNVCSQEMYIRPSILCLEVSQFDPFKSHIRSYLFSVISSINSQRNYGVSKKKIIPTAVAHGQTASSRDRRPSDKVAAQSMFSFIHHALKTI